MTMGPWWGNIAGALPKPDDLVVVRNRDADEAGDYRIMKHCEAISNPQWEITDIDPADLD